MPHGITQCYLPPGRGGIPALTPAEAGTRFSDPGGCKAELSCSGVATLRTAIHLLLKTALDRARAVCLRTDVGVQEMLESLGVEIDARSDETDASDATRIIRCVGVRLVAFVWSSDWQLNESSQQAHQCTNRPCSFIQLVSK